MYSYLFNIYDKFSPDIIISVLLKAEDRFTPYESIYVKTSGEENEWKANKQALWDIKDDKVDLFFNWLEIQHGFVPYDYIRRSCFAPYELYKVVKETVVYDITVETNEPVEDFGDPGSYFEDMPDAIY